MNAQSFVEEELEIEEYVEDSEEIVPEANPSTKLERRRKIEDLFEEKKLREELADFQ